MPFENGRVNWWALVAIVTPIITLLLGFLVSNWIYSKDNLFENLIAQNAAAIKQHNIDIKEVVFEIRDIDKIQNVRLRNLEDNISRICWALETPENRKRLQLPDGFKFPITSGGREGEKKE